jgi:hypothetical protein
MTEINSVEQRDHEISFKELILKLGEWRRYFARRWIWLLSGAIFFGGMGFLYASGKATQYEADLTFVVEEGKGSPLGAYAGLASQFGVDLGSSGGDGVFSGDNVMGFLKSRLMTESVLLSDTILEGKRITLADLYIDANHLNKGWNKNPSLSRFSFPFDSSQRSLNRQHDSVMSILYSMINRSNLVIIKPDKKLDFISVETVSPNEVFSKLFAERLVAEATRFYIDTRTQRSQASVDKLQKEADSILYALNRVTLAAAAGQDLNFNPAKHIAAVGQEFATRDKAILSVMYEEVRKNLEMSKMTLAQETPIIQVVDSPRFPLKKIKASLLLSLIAGGILGIVLTAFLIGIRKIYKELIN